ncbi:unnamed protein product [Porites evermanni]|uniref:Uncharacterized protein n=1 Tax=Porites evermanni TaxID=104178 RepID=A0ABN8PG37_9CNID|nr:unnamed protein product [Porites evermanni]
MEYCNICLMLSSEGKQLVMMNIGILTVNCQDCKTQEQRNQRHFFCGFI